MLVKVPAASAECVISRGFLTRFSSLLASDGLMSMGDCLVPPALGKLFAQVLGPVNKLKGNND